MSAFGAWVDRLEDRLGATEAHVPALANPAVVALLGAIRTPLSVGALALNQVLGPAPALGAFLAAAVVIVLVRRGARRPAAYGHWLSRAGLGGSVAEFRPKEVPSAFRSRRVVNLVVGPAAILAMIWSAWTGAWPILAVAVVVHYARRVWWTRICLDLHVAVTGVPLGDPLPRPVPFDSTPARPEPRGDARRL